MIETLLLPAVREFIHEHMNDDPAQLMLQAHRYHGLPMREIVQQIQAYKKAREKLPEWANSAHIVYPPLLSMEQCSSERTARLKATIPAGKTLLDLTGGAGVDTYYFSRKFEQVDYVEKEKHLHALATHNMAALGVENVRTHHMTAEDFLETQQRYFDCIYLDPARRGKQQERVFKLEETMPNVVNLLPKLFQKSYQVMIKASPMLDIQQGLRALEHVKMIVVVSIDNECKEVLYLLQKGAHAGKENISAINLSKDGSQQEFTYAIQDEIDAEVRFSLPLRYIYEPNAAILKAGAFKMIAAHYALSKLHPNSHLYTSSTFIDAFPGRSFELKAIEKPQKKLGLAIATRKANITVRNFPMTVAEIRAKTGLRDGGDKYLFATTNRDDQPVILICHKLT